MTKTFAALVLALPLAAQSPGTTPQAITGLLMDATCPAIRSSDGGDATKETSGDRASGRSSSSANRTSPVTDGPSHASATGTTGAASNVAVPSGGGGAARRDTELQPDRNMRRETEAATRGAATAGPSWASATGTTGAAVGATPPQAMSRSEAGSASRSRDGAAGTTESVASKYDACRPGAETTEFAIHATGKLYVLDQTSNEMVRNQMRNEAFRASMSNGRDGSRWMTVTVLGTPGPGDSLKVESVRK